MTNTPTGSESDKELREILDNHRFDQDWINTKHENHEGVSEHVNTCIVCNKMETISRQNIEAIKKAFNKQVDQLQTYKFTTGSEDKMVMLDDVKALYGGDKK